MNIEKIRALYRQIGVVDNDFIELDCLEPATLKKFQAQVNYSLAGWVQRSRFQEIGVMMLPMILQNSGTGIIEIDVAGSQDGNNTFLRSLFAMVEEACL